MAESKSRFPGKESKLPVNFYQYHLPVAIQLTAQFIRTLRNGILPGMSQAGTLQLERASTKYYLGMTPDTVCFLLPRCLM